MKRAGSVVLKMALLLTVLLTFAAGCGQQEQTVQPEELLKQVIAANQVSALRENNERVEYHETIYFPDGSIGENVIYVDGTMFAYETDAYLMLEDSGEVYVMDNGNFGQYIFFDDFYEEFAQTIEAFILSYSEEERVTSFSHEDGMLYMNTVATDTSLVEDYLGAGMLAEQAEEMYYEYVLDSETLELYSEKIKVKTESGEKILIIELVRSEQCEDYAPDAELMAAIDHADKRTVTIIANAGTEEEAVYSKEIPKGFSCIAGLPSSYEQRFYLDAGYTQPLTESAVSPEEDATYYVRSGDLKK